MIAEALYLLPTPAGAFFAVSESTDSPLRRFLLALISRKGKTAIAANELKEFSARDSSEDAREYVRELQEKGWLEVLHGPLNIPEYSMEYGLPRLLPALSEEGKVLLADTQGFGLFSHGFSADCAEELAALSADLANLHERRGAFLRNNLQLTGSAWALIGAGGHSQIGFWPLYIGNERLVLVIAGAPALNQPQLVDFVLLLHRRFRVP